MVSDPIIPTNLQLKARLVNDGEKLPTKHISQYLIRSRIMPKGYLMTHLVG